MYFMEINVDVFSPKELKVVIIRHAVFIVFKYTYLISFVIYGLKTASRNHSCLNEHTDLYLYIWYFIWRAKHFLKQSFD